MRYKMSRIDYLYLLDLISIQPSPWVEETDLVTIFLAGRQRGWDPWDIHGGFPYRRRDCEAVFAHRIGLSSGVLDKARFAARKAEFTCALSAETEHLQGRAAATRLISVTSPDTRSEISAVRNREWPFDESRIGSRPDTNICQSGCENRDAPHCNCLEPFRRYVLQIYAPTKMFRPQNAMRTHERCRILHWVTLLDLTVRILLIRLASKTRRSHSDADEFNEKWTMRSLTRRGQAFYKI